VHLATPDPEAAKRFYGSLFGWQFEDMPADPEMAYTFVLLGRRSVAGLYALSPQMRAQGVPPHWLPFINVTNADDTAAKAAQAGGEVVNDPMDVMDAGRMAVVKDPTGAHVAVWQAKTHRGADAVNETGAMCWNELMTPDIEAAGQFYRTTFGWTSDLVDTSADSSYTVFKAGSTQVGGMMARPPQMKEVPPHWLTYFSVADCNGTAAKATKLGGAILKPTTDIPDMGTFAVCRDPQGAVFAIFTPRKQ
jgi:predicted enzyme related to lactoylglutathione lyase